MPNKEIFCQKLKNNHEFSRSAKFFIRYAKKKGKTKEAAMAYFRAGLIYERMGNYKDMVRIFKNFISLCKIVPGLDRYVFEGLYKIAQGTVKMNDLVTAKKYYKQIVAKYNALGKKQSSKVAEFAAHAAFDIAEMKRQDFFRIKIEGVFAILIMQKKRIEQEAFVLLEEYEKITKYQNAHWTLAAICRKGTIFSHFAKKMASGYRIPPVPKKVKWNGQEDIQMYMNQMDILKEILINPINNMVEKLDIKCIEKEKQLSISNKYTEEAYKRLNAVAPNSWPLPKMAKVEILFEVKPSLPFKNAIRKGLAALRRNDKDVQAMIAIANAYYYMNKLEFAEYSCDSALRLNPKAGKCYYLKGLIASKKNKLHDALKYFKKATNAQPTWGLPWLNLGTQYLILKKYKEAVPLLKTAVKWLPKMAEAYLNLGNGYRGKGQVAKARQSYIKALKIKPAYPAAYFNLGILFLEAEDLPRISKRKQKRKAISYFRKYKRGIPRLKMDNTVDIFIQEAQNAYKFQKKGRSQSRKAYQKLKKHELVIGRKDKESLIKSLGFQTASAILKKIKELDNSKAAVRKNAALSLGNMGPKVALAIPKLINALGDSNTDVKVAVAKALGNIGTGDSSAVPALISSLQDRNTAVRITGAKALGKIGPEAVSAIPSLIKALRDAKGEVRVAAVSSLGKIGPKAVMAVPAIIKALKDKNINVRIVAAEALGKIGPKASSAIPRMKKSIKDRHIDVRVVVSEALGEMVPKAASAIPALIKALRDSDVGVRVAAASSLGLIDAKLTLVIPALIRALNDPSDYVKVAVASSLGRIGSEATSAIPELEKALNDQDAKVREAARKAIGKIVPHKIRSKKKHIQP
jgi:HEAT repeat protein